MKRDVRLQGLSTDHHHTLVWVRRIRQAIANGPTQPELGNEVATRLEPELGPHFGIEEDVLLPELRSSVARDLAERTLREHRLLRLLLADVRAGRTHALKSLADALEAHIRFEERELYPICESVLSSQALDEAARRAKKRE